MHINVFNLPGKRKHFGDNIPRTPSDRLSMKCYIQGIKKSPSRKFGTGTQSITISLYKPI